MPFDGQTTPIRGLFDPTLRTEFDRVFEVRDGPVEGPVDERLWKVPSISVRLMDFEHFKNRYGIDDTHHIIEVLRGSPHITDDIQAEWNRRREEGKALETKSTAMEDIVTSGPEYIQRVRIHSSVIMGHLGPLLGHTSGDTETPMVFFWPFASLVHYYPEMKDHLEVLEDRWGEDTPLEDFGCFNDAPNQQKVATGGRKKNDKAERTKPGPGGLGGGAKQKAGDQSSFSVRNNPEWLSSPANIQGDNAKASDDNSDGMDAEDYHLDSPTALRHMRCYIQFVERFLLPLERKAMERLNSGNRIRTNDLWHLFQLGDVVYVPSNSVSQAQTEFVICRKKPLRATDNHPDDFRNQGLSLHGYYVDNDGYDYGTTTHEFFVEWFEGEKAITELLLYPLRYTLDYEQRRAGLRRHGEHFRAMVEEKHVYCQGWTVPDSPLEGSFSGIATVSGYDTARYGPEHIDSDVIIDIKEALNQNAGWKRRMKLNSGSYVGESSVIGDDNMDICHWRDIQRTQLLVSIPDRIQLEENIANAMQARWEQSMGPIGPIGPLDIRRETGAVIPSGILVLPRRFFVYVLRDRRFASVDVMTMEKIPAQQDIFDDLEIDPNNKRLVKSLVAEHFQKRELQKLRPAIGSLNQDLIRGKGLGLFILLHGVPGVGKTATAEAVAQANGKPLFAITCGDLGFTPKEVEEELKSIFRLANMWDCVLLLDEADVFLARRDSWNLKRNALVSVFLRVLEYYSGILFLTTNRVGTIDEAFKSRIHISLYYDRLNRDQTAKIFQNNIDKLKRMEQDKEKKLEGSGVKYPKLKINQQSILKWALDYYNDAKRTGEFMQWNGRQIRNAFQIASSLARYDTTKEALGSGGERVPCPTLGARHFGLVAKAIEKFDTYMEHATGMADSDHARIEGTRADGMEFREEMQPKVSSRAASSRDQAPRPAAARQSSRANQERSGARFGSLPAHRNANWGKQKGKDMLSAGSRRFHDGGEEIEDEYRQGEYRSDEDPDYDNEEGYDNYRDEENYVYYRN